MRRLLKPDYRLAVSIDAVSFGPSAGVADGVETSVNRPLTNCNWRSPSCGEL
jgi:hypothetical protein